jgi:two-component system, cell cycle sensor histidine kinase and response regulator CckA
MHGDTCVETVETREETSAWSRNADQGVLAKAQTILLVEDEAFVRGVTVEVLRSAGYCVLSAANATEAVYIYDAHRHEVDLLLADVLLPGETGRALALRLRGEHAELKVLLVTGCAEYMGLREAMQEEFLAKPFSTEVLLGRVRQLLGRASVRMATGMDDPLRRACGSGLPSESGLGSERAGPRG